MNLRYTMHQVAIVHMTLEYTFHQVIHMNLQYMHSTPCSPHELIVHALYTR